MLKKVFLILNFILIVFGLTSCGQRDLTKRKYREVVVEPSLKTMPAMPANHPHIDLPPGHPAISGMPENFNSQSPSGSMMSADPKTQAQIQASAASIPLIWQTPAGWNEMKGSGLRLVTFQSAKDFPIECSIVSLGGMAGGLESNIHRWMGQINLSISDAEFEKFMQTQEKITSQGALPIILFDFTKLQTASPQDVPSMIAGILTIEEKTIFVKMTGTKAAVLHHKENFKQLCQSLQTKNE